MQIGPRYKKAKYLGASVFRKTQTQKYAMRSQTALKKKPRGRGGKSEYGKQMMEKQKARYSYGVGSGQFANYVKQALKEAGDNAKNLLCMLESRLDNVILRAGFTVSREAARQMVAHGHIRVGGKRVNIPSYQVKAGDIISVKESSRAKPLFVKLSENIKESATTLPSWLKIDLGKTEIKIDGEPKVDADDLLFDVKSVLEFYTR